MVFFVFKQKTAYEMRISDWSSDVCSSDLARRRSGDGRADRSQLPPRGPADQASDLRRPRIEPRRRVACRGRRLGAARHRRGPSRGPHGPPPEAFPRVEGSVTEVTTQTEYQDLLYEQDGGVATVTINRPERRNALRGQPLEELTHALTTAGRDEAVGVVVVTGAGDPF